MPPGAIGKLRKGINPAVQQSTPSTTVRAPRTGEGPANLIRNGRTRSGVGANNLIRDRPKGRG